MPPPKNPSKLSITTKLDKSVEHISVVPCYNKASIPEEKHDEKHDDRSKGRKFKPSSTYTFSRPNSGHVSSLDLSEMTDERLEDSPPQSPGRENVLFDEPLVPSPSKAMQNHFSAYAEPMPSTRGLKPSFAEESKTQSPPLLVSDSPKKARNPFGRMQITRKLTLEQELNNVKQITRIMSCESVL